MNPSSYVNKERRDYSLYILHTRALPHAGDGLKSAARRILWMAKDGQKYKSATLAGKTMVLHPHSSPESVVNTLAAPYNNNIPLLDGTGAFGTLLAPTSCGAARYTSVKVSQFTKDVMFRDIEIIPLTDNYDSSQEEPVHFLPLIPVVLLNPQEGIAVGFASTILPRSLEDIIVSQIMYLQGKNITEPMPQLTSIDQRAIATDDRRYTFAGSYETVNSTTVRVTNLPYGITHEKFIENLMKLEEKGLIQNYIDNSRDIYNIEVRFKRGILSNSDVYTTLGLVSNVSENLNVINFNGQGVWSADYVSIIKRFCDWRLGWYKNRYERLAALIRIEIQKYKDIITAIDNDVGGKARKSQSRAELKQLLTSMGIVYDDYIADLAVYRFTQAEKKKTEQQLAEAEKTLKEYEDMLASEEKRKQKFITELKEVLVNYSKQKYSHK